MNKALHGLIYALIVITFCASLELLLSRNAQADQGVHVITLPPVGEPLGVRYVVRPKPGECEAGQLFITIERTPI